MTDEHRVARREPRRGRRSSRRRTRSSNDDGTFVDELVLCRQQGDVPLVAAGSHRLHGRRARAARLDRRGAHSVPRARRREPRADGLEHAAPGRAASQSAHAARRHGTRGEGRARFRRGRHRAARRRRHARDGRRDHRRRRRRRERGKKDDGPSAGAPHAARPLPAQEVLAHQPGHRDQPASARAGSARR